MTGTCATELRPATPKPAASLASRSFAMTIDEKENRPQLQYFDESRMKGSLHIARVKDGSVPREVIFEGSDGIRQLRALAPSEEEQQRWVSEVNQLLATCATLKGG